MTMRALASSLAGAVPSQRVLPAPSFLPLRLLRNPLRLSFSNWFLCSPGWVRMFQQPSASVAASSAHAMANEGVPVIVVYVTVPDKGTGTKLAQSIIENKLAACVSQVPGVESTYWWEGKVEVESELLLIIKTRQSLLDALTAHVKSNHPYDTPEVIALPITGGNDKYLKWIEESTKKVAI